jgi:hypothetical protein
MARKRSVARRGPGPSQALKTVRALTRRAHAESGKLLRKSRAGTITRVDLDAGLKEIKKQLYAMTIHEHML